MPWWKLIKDSEENTPYIFNDRYIGWDSVVSQEVFFLPSNEYSEIGNTDVQIESCIRRIKISNLRISSLQHPSGIRLEYYFLKRICPERITKSFYRLHDDDLGRIN